MSLKRFFDKNQHVDDDELTKKYGLEQVIDERTELSDLEDSEQEGTFYAEVCFDCRDDIMEGRNLLDLNWFKRNAKVLTLDEKEVIVIPATENIKMWLNGNYVPKCPGCGQVIQGHHWKPI